MPPAKKVPNDQALKSLFELPHDIQDRANGKKWAAIQKWLVDHVKQVRDLLPDDAATRNRLFDILRKYAEEAVRLLALRSGFLPPPFAARPPLPDPHTMILPATHQSELDSPLPPGIVVGDPPGSISSLTHLSGDLPPTG